MLNNRLMGTENLLIKRTLYNLRLTLVFYSVVGNCVRTLIPTTTGSLFSVLIGSRDLINIHKNAFFAYAYKNNHLLSTPGFHFEKKHNL